MGASWHQTIRAFGSAHHVGLHLRGRLPAEGKGAGLVLPYCDTEAVQEHLAEIGRSVDDGAHAVLILDQAGWHVTPKLKVPDNITLMFLPPRSPELNPFESVWQTVCSLHRSTLA